ncbi:MAG: hypothetical protein EZS28_023257, partial [Streblomastix strix]
MMRQGGWVLLDGVESAPHEVERLMSLLEENPTLAIYESVKPLIFHSHVEKRDNQNDKEQNIQIDQFEQNIDKEDIEIKEGFQIFITCNDLKKLSPALRSRCFCIQMETAQDEVQLRELAESALNQSDTALFYRIPISRILGGVFCDARDKSKTRKLLFSKDTFSPHRIVNSARGIGNEQMTASNIASGIQMSFIRCFREDEDQKDISQNSENIIKQIGKEKIAVTVVGYLARSDLQIELFISNKVEIPTPKDANETVQIILKSNKNPIIRFGEQEFPAQIAEISQIIPTNQLQIKPLLDINLSSFTEQTHEEIFRMKELTAEQQFWIFSALFGDISSDLLVQNKLLSELIDAICQYKVKAIEIGKAPFGTSLLPLNSEMRKDLERRTSPLPQIVKNPRQDQRFDNAISVIIEYTIREEAISKAAENSTFENVVSMLASFDFNPEVASIVDPFIHLLQTAKEGQKLKEEDVKQLQSLSRAYLLIIINSKQLTDRFNTICLSEILQALINFDEHTVHILQNSPHNIKFIQFPTLQPIDLLSCIQLTTSSGTFSGPLVQTLQYNHQNIENFEPLNEKEALLKCAELLKGKDLRKQLEKKEIQQWNALIPYDQTDQILRRLVKISEEIKQQQFQPKWLIDPDSDIETLKLELSKNPGQGIAYQKYPTEYKQALIAKNEWENKRRLPILFILLGIFARNEEMQQEYQINNHNFSWEDRFHSILLQLDRKNQPFEYRIALLLGCELIKDIETQIARSVISTILRNSNPSRKILEQSGLDNPILLSIKKYVEKLLEIEKVPLETTPLIDLHTAFVYLILKELEEGKKKEQIELEEKNNRNRNLFIVALQDLIIDIQKWLIQKEREKNNKSKKQSNSNPIKKEEDLIEKTQWIKDAGQKIIEKAQNSYEDALEVARMIKLERSGYFSTGPFRLYCICKDDKLDEYFSEYAYLPYRNLEDKSKQFIVNFSKSSDDPFTLACDDFKRQFPDIENLSRQRSENSLFRERVTKQVKIIPYQIRYIIPAIKQFIPLFVPLSQEQTRLIPIDYDIIIKNENNSVIGKDFNALIGGSGKDQLRFISSSITADFGVYIDRAQTSNCGIVTIDNLSNDDVDIKIEQIDGQTYNLKASLKSSLVKIGERIDISFNIVGHTSVEPQMASTICKVIAKGIKKSNQMAICDIHAFIRQTPQCAIIKSSLPLIVNSDFLCAFAPKKFTGSVNITHRIPRASLSPRSFGWSLSSDANNIADIPTIQLDEEKQKMKIQFETDTTGLCAGQMTVGFGLSELYKLRLNVPVSQYPLVEIYHPANPKLTDISLVQSDYTHIIVR